MYPVPSTPGASSNTPTTVLCAPWRDLTQFCRRIVGLHSLSILVPDGQRDIVPHSTLTCDWLIEVT